MCCGDLNTRCPNNRASVITSDYYGIAQGGIAGIAQYSLGNPVVKRDRRDGPVIVVVVVLGDPSNPGDPK
jgi:hypothetical protein